MKASDETALPRLHASVHQRTTVGRSFNDMVKEKAETECQMRWLQRVRRILACYQRWCHCPVSLADCQGFLLAACCGGVGHSSSSMFRIVPLMCSGTTSHAPYTSASAQATPGQLSAGVGVRMSETCARHTPSGGVFASEMSGGGALMEEVWQRRRLSK